MIKNDWREKAAAMTAPDDLDMEKAFADMASGFVTNKLGDLMRDEHRVGFEIVKKNADNTRMLGIFAFKVDKKLLFAVVFFLNGEIKGPLLYRCDTQKFVPANKDWANYLIDNIEQSSGEGISKSVSRFGNDSRVMMYKLMTRPKSASIKAAAVEEFGEDVEAGMREAMLRESQPGVLRKFLTEPGIGKSAADMLEAATDNSPKFTSMLASLYPDPASLMPSAFTEVEKKASDNHHLEIIYGLTKEAAEGDTKQYFKDGFYLWDNRYLKDTCKVELDDKSDDIESVASAGTYSLLKSDGTLEEGCTVLPYKPANYDGQESPYTHFLIVKDGGVENYDKAKLLGILTGNYIDGTRNLEKGGVYIPYVKGNDIAGTPFYVHDVRKVDGVTYAKCEKLESRDMAGASFYIDRDEVNWAGRPHTFDVTVNPDNQSSNAGKGLYGKDALFVRVKDDSEDSNRFRVKQLKDLCLCGSQDAWVYSQFDLPTVKLDFDKEASYPYTFTDTVAGVTSDRLTRKEALVKLAAELRIPAPHAYTILDTVEKVGSIRFRLDGLGLDKEASMIRIVGRPDWSESGISSTGIPEDPEVQRRILGVEGDVNYHTPPHVGDAMDPTKPTGLPALTIVTSDPASLRDIADTYSLPHVFEHGVVGTLADTFDAGKLLEKYTPSMEDALDSTGRALFLLYWKPEDFERQYGKDDLANLEAQLESEYESFGALTLELLKKSGKQKNSVPEPGELV